MFQQMSLDYSWQWYCSFDSHSLSCTVTYSTMRYAWHRHASKVPGTTFHTNPRSPLETETIQMPSATETSLLSWLQCQLSGCQHRSRQDRSHLRLANAKESTTEPCLHRPLSILLTFCLTVLRDCRTSSSPHQERGLIWVDWWMSMSVRSTETRPVYSTRIGTPKRRRGDDPQLWCQWPFHWSSPLLGAKQRRETPLLRQPTLQ